MVATPNVNSAEREALLQTKRAISTVPTSPAGERDQKSLSSLNLALISTSPPGNSVPWHSRGRQGNPEPWDPATKLWVKERGWGSQAGED